MPKINKEKCISCGACISTCPNEAIKMGEDGKAEIEQEKCKNCRQCLEVCPVRAVEEN